MQSHATDGDQATLDLGPLAWVLDELRKSLDVASAALHRYVRDTGLARGSDLASVDDAKLRIARQQLHQAVGALEMVGLPAPAQMLRSMEAAVQRFTDRPDLCCESAAAKIERAGFALTQYLGAVLAGKAASPVALFPQYREIQELAGSNRIHPADLWELDFRWIEPELPASAEVLVYDSALRTRMDQSVLRVVRSGDVAAGRELCRICLSLATGSAKREPRIFWKISAGYFEALGLGLLPLDVHVKRAGSRVLMQYAQLAKGDVSVSDRLAHDLLFFCGQALPPDASHAPVLTGVRRAWGLTPSEPVDYETPQYGRFDPVLQAQARKRLAAAKEAWSGIAGGDSAKLRGLAEPFGAVSESLVKLYPESAPLAQALNAAVDAVVRAGKPPSAEVAMEVATAVLYLEAGFDEGGPTDMQLAARTARLAERLERVRVGGKSEPLESWIEELYGRVSDRQTMGSVVGELRGTLGELEKVLDAFFRCPDDKAPLQLAPGHLSQMRGVLSVLGLDQAAQAVLRMREQVEQILAEEQVDTPLDGGGTFERLGSNLGALGFLIDMLNYQPALAKKLFVYDDAVGELKPLMGRSVAAGTAPAQAGAFISAEALSVITEAQDGTVAEALSAKLDILAMRAILADQAGIAQTAREASAAIACSDEGAATAALNTLAEAVQVVVPVAPSVAVPAGDFEEDDLRGIFLDEAREVVQTGQAALEALAQDPRDTGELTTLRRAFHTLKGSSRMVGLTEFGDAGWAMEQVLNTWLADQKPASEDLRALCGAALRAFGLWVEAIARNQDGAWNAQVFRHPADTLRTEQRLVALVLPSVAEAGSVETGPALALPEPADLAERVSDALPIEVQSELPQVETHADAPGLARLVSAGEVVYLDHVMLAHGHEPVCATSDAGADSAPVEFTKQVGPVQDTTPLDIGLETDIDIDLQDTSPAELATQEPVSGPASNPVDPQVPCEPTAFEDEIPAALDDCAALPANDGAMFDVLLADEALAPGRQTHAPADDVRGFGHAAADVGAVDLTAPTAIAPGDGAGLDPAVPDGALDAAAAAPDDMKVAIPLSAVHEAPAADEQVKVIGDLRLGIPLYNVYLNEADEWSRRLLTEVSEWALELNRPVPDSAVGLAHALAGASATVGFHALSEVARALETALSHAQGLACGTPRHGRTFTVAAEEIRRLLHQFAAGFLKEPDAAITAALVALADQAGAPAQPVSPRHPQPSVHRVGDDEGEDGDGVEEQLDAVDAVDFELFPIFEEEAAELMPQLGGALRQWAARPENRSARDEVLRALHTLKGSARLTGALRLGELAHRMESEIEQIGSGGASAAEIEPLLHRYDRLQGSFERLRATGGKPAPIDLEAVCAAEAAAVLRAAAELPATAEVATGAPPAVAEGEAPLHAAPSRGLARPAAMLLGPQRVAANHAVRVRSQLLDRLVNRAGEVMITRSRLEAELGQLRASLNDLTGNLERMRAHLRDIELQAESQMQSRLAQAKDVAANFDPLEFDRFTRVQELTRMMAESVNDVATVQRNLQRTVEATQDGLIAQGRQTRELQRDLLRTRMVEFEGISDRLYRVVRLASKETGKQVRLDISGGSIEMDRGVLDRMTPAFEHLLRNCVAHGIEDAAARTAAGKDPAGTILIALNHQGNDVSVEFRDDGAGLDLPRIRQKALQQGITTPGQVIDDGEAANLIFMPGFSTASQVTELAGRGIGMDVVRSEVNALGGRIETRTESGRGTSFKLVLPLTTAVTQVVLVRTGTLSIGVPANVVETVLRVPSEAVQQAYASGLYEFGGEQLPFYWSGALLQASQRSCEPAKSLTLVVFKSAAQRIAVHVDQVLGNHEAVVKNLGPQLARLPGLAGMTVLASGAVVLIYNPVALTAVYGEQARRLGGGESGESAAADGAPQLAGGAAAAQIPLVLVVDDSITVRRVTQRLLQREGYRVAMAADGVQALARLAEEKPAVILSDIEMPRMDGFDLARNIRSDDKLAGLPIIMITSRIAAKHREHARAMGVNHYLGKPYSDEELLSLVRHHCGNTVDA